MIKHASDNMLELLKPIFNNDATNLKSFISAFGDKLDYIEDFIIKISNAYNFNLVNESEVVFNIDYVYKIDFHLDQIAQGIVGKATIYQNSDTIDIEEDHTGKYIIIDNQVRKIISFEDGVSTIEGVWTSTINTDYSIVDYIDFYQLKTDEEPVVLNQATTPFEFFNQSDLFFIDNGVYTRELYEKIDIGGAVFEDMELYHIWGIYDEIGLLLGCPRITAERNVDYIIRLKDVFTNPGNSTTKGLTNYLKRALGAETVEFEALDKKLEELNTPILSNDLIEYIDLSHKINNVDTDKDWETFRQLKKGEVFLANHIGQGAEYLPFEITSNEKVLNNSVQNDQALFVTAPRLEDEYEFTGKVFHKKSEIAETEFYPELIVEYAELSDEVGTDAEATHFKATILAGESTGLEFTVSANKQYKEKWLPNSEADVDVTNSINTVTTIYEDVIVKGTSITTSPSDDVENDSVLNYFDGTSQSLIVRANGLLLNNSPKGLWMSPVYSVADAEKISFSISEGNVVECSINGGPFETVPVSLNTIEMDYIKTYQIKVIVRNINTIDNVVMTSADDICTKVNHGFVDDQYIRITDATDIKFKNKDYYVVKVDNDKFQLKRNKQDVTVVQLSDITVGISLYIPPITVTTANNYGLKYVSGAVDNNTVVISKSELNDITYTINKIKYILNNVEVTRHVMNTECTIIIPNTQELIIREIEVDCKYSKEKDYTGEDFKSSPLSFNGKGNLKNKLLSILWKEGQLLKSVISENLPYWLDINDKELVTTMFSIKISEEWQANNPNINITPLYEITNINIGGNLALSNVTNIRVGGDLDSTEDPEVANGRSLIVSSEYQLMVQNTNPVSVHYLEDTIIEATVYPIPLIFSPALRSGTEYEYGYRYGWTSLDPKDITIVYENNEFTITPISSNVVTKVTTTIESIAKTTINVYNTLNSTTIESFNDIKVLSVYDKYSRLFIDNSVIIITKVGNNYTFSCSDKYKREIGAQSVQIEQLEEIVGICRLNNDYTSDPIYLLSGYTFDNLYIQSDNPRVQLKLIKIDEDFYIITGTINNYNSRIQYLPIINSGIFNINMQKYHIGNKTSYKPDLNLVFSENISFTPGLHSYEAALITGSSDLDLYTTDRILTTTFDLDGNLYPSATLYVGEHIITKEN